MNTLSYTVLIVVSVVFALLRFLLPSHGLKKEDIFKDLAHVFVGGLFGAALATNQSTYWILAVGLTVIEVIAATMNKLFPR